jgi:hypothetical protein
MAARGGGGRPRWWARGGDRSRRGLRRPAGRVAPVRRTAAAGPVGAARRGHHHRSVGGGVGADGVRHRRGPAEPPQAPRRQPEHRDQPDQGERSRAAQGSRAVQPRRSRRGRALHAPPDARVGTREALRRDRVRPPRGGPVQRVAVRADSRHPAEEFTADGRRVRRVHGLRPCPRGRVPTGRWWCPAVHQHCQHRQGHGRHPGSPGRSEDQLRGLLLRHLPGGGVRQPVPRAVEPQRAGLVDPPRLAVAGTGQAAVGGGAVQRRAVGDLGRAARRHLPPGPDAGRGAGRHRGTGRTARRPIGSVHP